MTQAAVSRLRPIVMDIITDHGGRLVASRLRIRWYGCVYGANAYVIGHGLLFSLPVVLFGDSCNVCVVLSKASVSRTKDGLYKYENTLNAEGVLKCGFVTQAVQ
ncbi:hypothetical protein O9993_15730 [Vibrio lentus]|nr:hypothetical protein [Vibrio lentus]